MLLGSLEESTLTAATGAASFAVPRSELIAICYVHRRFIMADFDCPKCGQKNEIEFEDLPSRACDTDPKRCQHCGVPLQVGWEAIVTAEIDLDVVEGRCT